MSLFDIIAGLVLFVSAIIGLSRGATREVTTVIAFVAAAVIAVFALRYTGPLARHMVATPWMANVAALLVAFVVAYLALRAIGGMLIRGVQGTVLSGPDRILGGGIGVARGLVAVGAVLLLIDAATPPERMLRVFAPQGWKLATEVAPGVESAVLEPPRSAQDRLVDDSPPAHSSSGRDSGYSERQRKALDVLVEKSR